MFDVVIVGGGMVGSACAAGLAEQGMSVAMIEASPPAAYDPQQPPDLRVSAISAKSEALLSSLGAWSYVQAMRLCPYRRLSVWEQPKGRTDFNCADLNKSHLGHIVENRVIQLALHQVIATLPNVRCFWREKIVSLTLTGWPEIRLQSGELIKAKVIIGADGIHSMVRQAADIGVTGWQYSQHALGITIKTDGPQQDITWQQFTPQGPLAFLPLYDGFASLVWYGAAPHLDALKRLSDSQLKQQILQHFPQELPDFSIIDKASFPLTRMHARRYFNGPCVLVGDAAHGINPLAGQGLNLGFKDVDALLQSFAPLRDKWQHSDNISELVHAWFTQYEQARRRDNLLMMSAMDCLYAGFANNLAPLKILRNLGLSLAQRAGPLKQHVMKYAMGL